jgi:hypothetical protein
VIDLVGTVVASLLDRPVKAALDQFWPHANELSAAIDGLVDGQERQLLAPVYRAVSHLELGELSEARRFLIEAESLHRHAPVIKLVLASTLAHLGTTGEPVERRVREALTMNPFLAPMAAGHGGPRQVAATSQPVDWTQSLSHFKVVQKNKIVRTFMLRASTSARAPEIRQAALTRHFDSDEGTVVVRCESGNEFPSRRHTWIIAFNLRDGEARWGLGEPLADGELVLASPAVLTIHRTRKGRASIHLVDMATGVERESMSPTSYAVLFWPSWVTRPRLSQGAIWESPYGRSHITLEHIPIRYIQSDRQKYPAGDPVAFTKEVYADWKSLFAGEAEPPQIIDTGEASLSDPLDPAGTTLVTAKNTKRWHRFIGSYSTEADLRVGDH